MNRSILALILSAAAAACSGSGTSTTDRASETDGDAVTSGPSSSSTNSAATGETSSAPDTESGPTTDDSAGTTVAEGGSAEVSTGEPSDTDTDPEVTIVGTWLSEGKNVAPILVELASVESITAIFEDSPFTVLTTDSDGQEVEQTGVYIFEDTDFGEIKTITLEQSTPQSITVEGIFEIDNSTNPPTMRYEVVQTIPSVGAEAPTAEGGFGSTGLGSDLTQVFVWQQG